MESNNFSKGIRSIVVKKEQIETINKMDSSINNMLNQYIDSATMQVIPKKKRSR